MDTTSFDQWALVELFGHARIAGRVTEQQIGGASFIRVDVPELEIRKNGGDLAKRAKIKTEVRPAFSRLFGAAAIYSITPMDEATARLAAAQIRPEPISIYIPNERHMLPEGGEEYVDG